MKRCSRRAFFLLQEVIVLLPVLLVLGTVAFGLVYRGAQLQSRLQAQAADEARLRDLVGRVRADADGATAVAGVEDAGEAALKLVFASGREVTYRVDERAVTRRERGGDAAEQVYRWPFEQSRVWIEQEKIASSPGVVWVIATREVTREVGPMQTRRLATAVAVGRGGGA